MVLTVVVGSSGSGKTTFLNDTAKQHHCTYIKQYHNVRPYVTVARIPNFDPTQLPYWDIYVKEKKDQKIQVGGTMAGEFTAGLSGGQRKLLLFELIYQRTKNQNDLLLVLDEPFAGVTDDFVPFILGRLEEMKQHHNVLLVTNDHVEKLKELGDNTITVSAIDRSTVQVNGLSKVPREKALQALSVGEQYSYEANMDDLKFFYEVEVLNSPPLKGVIAFTLFAFVMFLLTFWDSDPVSAALVIVAGSIIAFFCMNPYLLSLVDWRNFMSEEAEALLHSSKTMNKMLKSILTIILIVAVSLVEWGVVNAVIDGFEDVKFWIAILADSASLTFPFIIFGIYSKLPFHAVEIFASMPFLFMIFFSTTFSPGSGVELLKEFRFLFARFYFWCMIPNVRPFMEGCPSDDVIVLYMVLSASVGLALFLVYQAVRSCFRNAKKKASIAERSHLQDDPEFRDLQIELYGEAISLRDSLHNTNHSRGSNGTKPAKLETAVDNAKPATEATVTPKTVVEDDMEEELV